MELIAARRIALNLMIAHLTNSGRPGWVLSFNDKKSEAASCSYSRKTIVLSRSFIEACDEAQLRNTVLHEIAHSLTPGHHHDSVWRAKHISLGGNGARTSSVELSTYLYVGKCRCGNEFKAHRLGSTKRMGIHSVPHCGTSIIWVNTRTGERSFKGRTLAPAEKVW